MIKANFNAEDIETMKNKIVEYEDWEFNENLPEGWMVRVTSMEHLIASIGVGRKLSNYDWHENDDLPPGWKIGTTAGNEKRMSNSSNCPRKTEKVKINVMIFWKLN